MMPNAEPRANYCSLWSGSNLWNIWVNYLPPLARLSRVSWPWHALFMFNIIMKSPLCKLCNYFKWSYNNVRHRTGCSTRAKIKFSLRDARVRAVVVKSKFVYSKKLYNDTLVKIHRIATIVTREEGKGENWKFYGQQTKTAVSTDLTMFDKNIFRQFLFPIPPCAMSGGRVTRGPGRVTPPGRGLLSPQLSRGLTLTRLTSPRTEL